MYAVCAIAGVYICIYICYISINRPFSQNLINTNCFHSHQTLHTNAFTSSCTNVVPSACSRLQNRPRAILVRFPDPPPATRQSHNRTGTIQTHRRCAVAVVVVLIVVVLIVVLFVYQLSRSRRLAFAQRLVTIAPRIPIVPSAFPTPFARRVAACATRILPPSTTR